MGTITNLQNARDEIVAEAKSIVARAKGAGDLGIEDSLRVKEIHDRVKTFDAQIAQAKSAEPEDDHTSEDSPIVAQVKAMGSEPKVKAGTKTTGNHLALTGRGAKAAAGALATAMVGETGAKSLTGSGTAVTGTPMEDQTPIEMDRVPTSFLDVLAAKQHATPEFTYLRQTARDNKAAPWKPGDGNKPESKYTVENVTGKLSVIPHMSEGMDRYTLLDNSTLADFLNAEMVAGLREAVEGQVMNGDGTGNNMTGVLATTGIAEQAYDTDLVTTTRKAVTALESVGRVPGVFVLSPTDWETLELARNTSGQFDLAHTAVDRSARKLHGVQVVVSTAMPEGVAVLLDLSAVRLDTDAQGISAEWGTSGDDFSQNRSRLRVEGRFGVSVLRPTGVVKIATASA